MITATIYEARRLLSWHWRIKFTSNNGEKLGHQYNNHADAMHAIALITNPSTQVRVVTRYRDGTITEHEDAGHDEVI